MKKFTKLLFGGVLLLLLSSPAIAQQNKQQISSIVGKLIRVTPKLADIDPTTMYGQPLKITRDKDRIIGYSEEGEERLERKLHSLGKHYADMARQAPQTVFPNTPITALNQNFDGQTWSSFDPSDNNLAVGPNHVIQIINDLSGSRFKIWNKAGGVVGNTAGTVLSSLTGVPGLGDPIVMYDQLADRWIMSEFGPGGSSQNYLVMAVSVTGDPTGAYKIYQYTDNTFFPDYPKYSVWHNAYYARSSDFNTAGTAYLGGSIYAFDRNAMLAGAATATMVRLRLLDAGSLSYYNMNTIGLDGTTPSTQSGLFAVPNQANSTINLFEFTPNFTTPASSMVGPLIPIAIAPYSLPPTNVAQQGSTARIETLGDRLMYRLSYRNRGGTESILIGHTVQGATSNDGAVRWYEFRKTTGNWGLYQQGTITGNDGNSRIMPGISMDALGNIALMYNVSGATAFPSIRYTARNECDPLGQMTLPEQTIVNGTNAHAPFGGTDQRWGDYNTLVADPSITGSFWGTAEYGAAPSGNGTRISNFTISGGAASFVTQPVSTTVCAGTTASFSATAAGNPPLTYQWQVSTDNGATWTNIPAATASTYSFTAVTGDNGKQFRCVATSSCGSGTSNTALLTITTLSQGGTISPATSVACAGTNSTTLTLNGYIGNIIRWESSIDGGTTWVNIANTTTSLTATNTTQTTLYRALVQSSGCSASYSTVGTINFITPGIGPLTITANQGTTLCAGDPTLLTAMGLTTNAFSNTGAILVPATGTSGIAAPYPSTIVVSGLPTTGVSVKSVTLTNINHTWSADMSILLQSPTGQNVILMSNVGGTSGITNSTYTFDDAAATGLASASPSGTYKPTNNSTTRNWPAPGPGVVVQGTNPLLSSFTGSPNGTWKLYAFDASAGDAGNINGGYSITFASTGIIPGLTYTWSPATGLNTTTGNPVAASPAVSTTYTVNAVSAAGCTSSASIAITVNARPSVTLQPLPITVCEKGNATFTATGAGTGLSLQWQESTNGGTTYTNITNGGIYSGATTSTLTLTGVTAAMNNNLYRIVVTGTCTPVANSNGAKLTVNPAPAVVVNPVSACGGIAGTNGTLLTASGASSYTWSPVAGLYTDAAAATAYTGSSTAAVYAAPTAFTAYTVTGKSAATGCTNTATASINYTPTAPIINPSPANLCITDSIIMLTKAQPKTLSFTSGAINIPIHDNDVTGGKNSINVSGIPAGAFITGVVVKMNAIHTWAGDLVIALKAPNNQILNLDYCLSQTNNGTGVLSPIFANTLVNSTGGASLGSGTQPYTGTFKADASTAATFFGAPTGPTGFDATTGQWSDLYSIPNGNWTLAWADVFPGGDVGTFTDWSIDISYQVGTPSTSPVWSPAAGLYTNATATIPYTAGTPRDTVWAKIPQTPLPGTYNYQVTANSLLSAAAPIGTSITNFTPAIINGLITFNVKNNNNYDVMLTDISSIVEYTDVHDVAAFYKPSPINGLPGVIDPTNGWNQFGSASITGTGAVQPFMSSLTLIIPAGATYGIAVQSEEVGFGADILYDNNLSGNYVFTTGGCSIITGTNIGYGGGLAPAAPLYTPRGFIGSVTFAKIATPCTSPTRTVTITINDSVKIVTQPVNASACMDKAASYTVKATGTGLTYQWQVRTPTSASFSNINNSGVYSGANQATLVITAPPASMNGYQYQCVISGASPCGGKTTNIVVLTVNPFPVVSIDASLYHKLFPGLRTTVFSTVGAPGGTYTWLRNGTVVQGTSGNSLVVNIDQLGTYKVQYTDINGCTSTSNAVSITDSTSGRVFIYPTPNAGQFQVRYNNTANGTNFPRGLNVYDATGKRVLSQNYPLGSPYARMDVDLSNFSTGVYWVEVVDASGNRLAIGRTEVLR